MAAYPLTHENLTSQSYTDASVADLRIDALTAPRKLRAKIHCVEELHFSVDYHPTKYSIGSALLVELNDWKSSPYPLAPKISPKTCNHKVDNICNGFGVLGDSIRQISVLALLAANASPD
ncbi:hypothetical protein FIBSPDRAFT_958313 [Athelia psychrophila]|uniref:Uncharacterized protein n=1 Tax=Athelia psychrophila TaxID=1759441 RepID=A0A166EVC2_9AGAM|nr:hypothetical protein FIBSPDRAFT_958313 [Fibularhizoctonia sp. CBS 109695]